MADKVNTLQWALRYSSGYVTEPMREDAARKYLGNGLNDDAVLLKRLVVTTTTDWEED